MSWLIDNPVFRGINKLLDVICVNLLWLLFCIPVVTAGASTTALYYVTNKTIKNNRGYIIRGFFSSFKENFKQSTIVWLFFLVWIDILGINYYLMYSFAKAGEPMGKSRIVVYALSLIILAWSLYVFPYIARFNNTTKEVLKNTFIIAVANVPTTVIMIGLLVGYCYIIYLWTPVILVLPVIYNLLKSVYIEKVFRKYMSVEQIEHEQEINGVIYDDSNKKKIRFFKKE